MIATSRSDRTLRESARKTLAFAAFALLFSFAGRAGADGLALPEPAGAASDRSARLVRAGNDAFLHGDLETAARDYHAALRRKPASAIATFNLGLVEMHTGKNAAGAADMNRGIALANKSGMVAHDLAKLRALRATFTPNPIETT